MGVLLWTCALPMFLGTAYTLTVQPIVTLQRDNDVRRQLIGNTVASRPSGTGPVILEGRIDPELVVPPDAGGLALVERETLRTDSSWHSDLFAHPDFTLLLSEGSVPVTKLGEADMITPGSPRETATAKGSECRLGARFARTARPV